MHSKKAILVLISTVLLLAESATASNDSTLFIEQVPYCHQEQGYWCGPAALQMVLQYWGTDVNQSTIALDVYDENKCYTSVEQMENYPETLGFQSQATTSSIEQLKASLQKGAPAIVLQKISLDNPNGHYRVVVGFDDTKQVFVTNDPDGEQNHLIDYSEFVNLWNNGSTFTTKNWTLIIEPSIIYSTPETTATIPSSPISTATLIAGSVLGMAAFLIILKPVRNHFAHGPQKSKK